MEQNQSNGKATASLVLGIVSIVLIFFGVYGEIFGIVCGIVGMILAVKARNENPSGIAVAGLVCSIVGTVLCAIGFVACACVLGGLASASAALQ